MLKINDKLTVRNCELEEILMTVMI